MSLALARRLVAPAGLLAGLRGRRLGRGAAAGLHAMVEGLVAAFGLAGAREPLVRVVTDRGCDQDDNKDLHPAFCRAAPDSRSPSRIANARCMEKSRVVRSNALTFSGIMYPCCIPGKTCSSRFFMRAAAPRYASSTGAGAW